MPEPTFITIKIIGVEDLESTRRTTQKNARATLRFYGHRVNDIATRLVVIELLMEEAVEYLGMVADQNDFSEIEIDNRYWAYVIRVGENDARFKKEGGPNGTPAG